MPHVLIGGETTVEIHPIIHDHPSEGRVVVLPFDDTYRILEEWTKLAPARRSYRWASDDDDSDPSRIIIAEAARNSVGNPTLLFETVEPYWDGVGDLNQYPLEDLGTATNALEWGEAIGEEAL